jgi:hypothetical protein
MVYIGIAKNIHTRTGLSMHHEAIWYIVTWEMWDSAFFIGIVKMPYEAVVMHLIFQTFFHNSHQSWSCDFSFTGPLWAYCVVAPLQYFGCFIVVVALMLLGGQTLMVMQSFVLSCLEIGMFLTNVMSLLPNLSSYYLLRAFVYLFLGLIASCRTGT